MALVTSCYGNKMKVLLVQVEVHSALNDNDLLDKEIKEKKGKDGTKGICTLLLTLSERYPDKSLRKL